MLSPETAANCAICLTKQTTYLLDQQLRSLEKVLAEKGDYKDRYREVRKKQMLSGDDDFDEFLNSFGLKRSLDGKISSLKE